MWKRSMLPLRRGKIRGRDRQRHGLARDVIRQSRRTGVTVGGRGCQRQRVYSPGQSGGGRRWPGTVLNNLGNMFDRAALVELKRKGMLGTYYDTDHIS